MLRSYRDWILNLCKKTLRHRIVRVSFYSCMLVMSGSVFAVAYTIVLKFYT